MEAVPRDRQKPGTKWIVWIHCDFLGGEGNRLLAGCEWSNCREAGANDTRDAQAVNPFARHPAIIGSREQPSDQSPAASRNRMT
jgi:hypothetical protein